MKKRGKRNVSDSDPPYRAPTGSSPKKKKSSETVEGTSTTTTSTTAATTATAKPATRGKRSSLTSQSPSEANLRRSRRRARVSMEVTVTTSDEEEVADEAETAADYFRQTSMDLLESAADNMFGGYDAPGAAGMAVLAAPAPTPKFYELTPQLLESLMAPVGLYQSPSEDGTEKELRLRMPVDFGGGCVGVCDILFNEHLGVKIDGATDWMPVNFVGDYLDPESVEVPDTLFTYVEEALSRLPATHARGSNKRDERSLGGIGSPAAQSLLCCKEEFHKIAAVLDMNEWMGKVIHKTTMSSWMWEHDYAEPTLKFGRPRSANILQDAVAAFNKYVNFIRLSERREPFLFGLWWEKEDTHADYWLLPKQEDEEDFEFDNKRSMVVIPIANEWTEEVVVAIEETVDFSGANGVVSPMTFWDNRGFLSFAAWSSGETPEQRFESADGRRSPIFKKPADGKDAGGEGRRKRTTATPVVRAPRFLAPKLDPSTAFLFDGTLNANGLPDNLDELVSTIQNHRQSEGQIVDGVAFDGRSGSQASATGSQLKNLSKEKLDEIDFAMRCIKELQKRRYSGPCRLHCRICSREFTAPTSLIVHYRSHAGIKPFTCPICLTSFTRRHSLKYHMLCHSGQARFRCNLCERLFRHSGHYRDHMRKHEQGTPFRCNDCKRYFATRTTFRRHMTVVHNTTNPQKGKGRSVGVSKVYGEMEGVEEMEAGEIGEVAEEIEYEGEVDEEDEEDEIDMIVAAEVRASERL